MGFSTAFNQIWWHSTPRKCRQWGFRQLTTRFHNIGLWEIGGNGVFDSLHPDLMILDPWKSRQWVFRKPTTRFHNIGLGESGGNGFFNSVQPDLMILDPGKSRQWGFWQPTTKFDDNGPWESAGNGVFDSLQPDLMTFDTGKVLVMELSTDYNQISWCSTGRESWQMGFPQHSTRFDDIRPRECAGNGVFDSLQPDFMTLDPGKVQAMEFSTAYTQMWWHWTPRKSW